MIRNIVFVFKRVQPYTRLWMWSFLGALSDINFQFIPVKTVNNLCFFFFFVMTPYIRAHCKIRAQKMYIFKLFIVKLTFCI